MALRLSNKLPGMASKMISVRQMSGHGHDIFYSDQKELCGTREAVGHGKDGSYQYYDGHETPFPAIRFSPEDATSRALREKEKGDWKKLTIEEKKALYRHSFCQTFAEFQAPDPTHKAAFGLSLIGIAIAYGVYLGIGAMMPTHPYREFYDSFEVKQATEQRRLDAGIYRHKGFGPYWDYEKRNWKE